jgi:hypothetical protein
VELHREGKKVDLGEEPVSQFFRNKSPVELFTISFMRSTKIVVARCIFLGR